MFVTLYDKDIEDSIRYQVNENHYIEQLTQEGLYPTFEAGLNRVRNDYIIPTEQYQDTSTQRISLNNIC